MLPPLAFTSPRQRRRYCGEGSPPAFFEPCQVAQGRRRALLRRGRYWRACDFSSEIMYLASIRVRLDPLFSQNIIRRPDAGPGVAVFALYRTVLYRTRAPPAPPIQVHLPYPYPVLRNRVGRPASRARETLARRHAQTMKSGAHTNPTLFSTTSTIRPSTQRRSQSRTQ